VNTIRDPPAQVRWAPAARFFPCVWLRQALTLQPRAPAPAGTLLWPRYLPLLDTSLAKKMTRSAGFTSAAAPCTKTCPRLKSASYRFSPPPTSPNCPVRRGEKRNQGERDRYDCFLAGEKGPGGVLAFCHPFAVVTRNGALSPTVHLRVPILIDIPPT
jgi:hypothetical protein